MIDTTLNNLMHNPKSMDLSVSYYEDMSRVSNSSMGYYEVSPLYYYKMMNGLGAKLDTSFLRRGTMKHKYVLEKGDFWSDYKISKATIPSSAQQKLFVENYVLNTHVDPILKASEAFKSSYSTKGKSDDKIEAEALEMVNTFKEFIDDEIERIINNDDRLNITFGELTELKTIEKNIQDHKKANELIYPTDPNIETYSEHHINWVHDTGIQCKSLIDRLLINDNTKTITLVDLKTTSKINKFDESMIEYGYYRQIAFYKQAIKWWLENIKDIDFSNYSFEAYIVAISTDVNTKNEIRVFSISKDYTDRYDIVIDNILTNIKWHNDNNTFQHSKHYYDGDGCDILKIAA